MLGGSIASSEVPRTAACGMPPAAASSGVTTVPPPAARPGQKHCWRGIQPGRYMPVQQFLKLRAGRGSFGFLCTSTMAQCPLQSPITMAFLWQQLINIEIHLFPEGPWHSPPARQWRRKWRLLAPAASPRWGPRRLRPLPPPGRRQGPAVTEAPPAGNAMT